MSSGISTMNIQEVKSVSVVASSLVVESQNRTAYTVDVNVIDKHGNRFGLTLFSDEPLAISLGGKQ